MSAEDITQTIQAGLGPRASNDLIGEKITQELTQQDVRTYTGDDLSVQALRIENGDVDKMTAAEITAELAIHNFIPKVGTLKPQLVHNLEYLRAQARHNGEVRAAQAASVEARIAAAVIGAVRELTNQYEAKAQIKAEQLEILMRQVVAEEIAAGRSTTERTAEVEWVSVSRKEELQLEMVLSQRIQERKPKPKQFSVNAAALRAKPSDDHKIVPATVRQQLALHGLEGLTASPMLRAAQLVVETMRFFEGPEYDEVKLWALQTVRFDFQRLPVNNPPAGFFESEMFATVLDHNNAEIVTGMNWLQGFTADVPRLRTILETVQQLRPIPTVPGLFTPVVDFLYRNDAHIQQITVKSARVQADIIQRATIDWQSPRTCSEQLETFRDSVEKANADFSAVGEPTRLVLAQIVERFLTGGVASPQSANYRALHHLLVAFFAHHRLCQTKELEVLKALTPYLRDLDEDHRLAVSKLVGSASTTTAAAAVFVPKTAPFNTQLRPRTCWHCGQTGHIFSQCKHPNPAVAPLCGECNKKHWGRSPIVPCPPPATDSFLGNGSAR